MITQSVNFTFYMSFHKSLRKKKKKNSYSFVFPCDQLPINFLNIYFFINSFN
jgi:hypothetical protein